MLNILFFYVIILSVFLRGGRAWLFCQVEEVIYVTCMYFYNSWVGFFLVSAFSRHGALETVDSTCNDAWICLSSAYWLCGISLVLWIRDRDIVVNELLQN